MQKLLCDNVAAGHGLVTGRSLSLGGADTHIYTQTCRQRGVCVCGCWWNGVRRESEAGEVRERGGQEGYS